MTPGEVMDLTKPVQTKIGVFSAGLPVQILRMVDDHLVRVCFDLGHHPTGKCHSRVLPTKELRKRTRR